MSLGGGGGVKGQRISCDLSTVSGSVSGKRTPIAGGICGEVDGAKTRRLEEEELWKVMEDELDQRRRLGVKKTDTK
jgi:hypothetical protein